MIGCALQLISAITSHFGETLVRLRFTEYVGRFVRLASRYEEVATGSTTLGFPSAPFVEGSLGKGFVFPDETMAARELATNASRIEGWRRTKSYEYSTIVRHTWLMANVILQRNRTFKNFAPRMGSEVLIYCINFPAFVS